MPRCPQCSAELPPGSSFCLKCGASLKPADADAMETAAMDPAEMARPAIPRPATPRSFPASHMATSGIPAYRFDPGTLLASRYRIISRLGKGGMGEVFRADDIMLGQTVALKFLTEAATGNMSLLTRFYDEVRIARQITHANVCRVYDIGEVEGQPYLSMEYVDGEDLGSLLRRIGRLPADKATEFARKMCAGLAAAHKQGVLHRDLKPANIMIDGQGEIHIMDFGLAAVATQLQGAEARSGTPAYMAPEQLEGREVSVQSDLYALGLVFYEMFTGKPAHRADTVAQMLELRRSSSVTNPSQLAADIDPAVERAILRCLDPDPKLRPASALALAASLPGGDPLAAALAAGETPSPEVVAASGSTEGLSPKIAILALAGIAVGLIATCLLIPKVQFAAYVPLENPPEALKVKAREIVRSIGYTETPVDTESGFYYENIGARYDAMKAKGPAEWRKAVASIPSPVRFGYRQSPAPLVSREFSDFGRVSFNDPLPNLSGMAALSLDTEGRLMGFDAVPPQLEKPGVFPAPDWAPMFAAAHLDPAQLQPDDPQWTPLAATDVRSAWTGKYPGAADVPIRVEAAAFHGRPVHFEIVFPWTKPARMPVSSKMNAGQAAEMASELLYLLIMVGAVWLAHFNWKAGRGDLRGATRLAIFMASVTLLNWFLRTHHLAHREEQDLFTAALSTAAFVGMRYWVFYLALEPWVRRYWPQNLVTWARLLAGRWRDPLVGRDVLFGILLGVVYLLLFLSFFYANLFHGISPQLLLDNNDLNGARYVGATIASRLDNSLYGALLFFMFLFVLRAVCRKQWLAGLVFVLI